MVHAADVEAVEPDACALSEEERESQRQQLVAKRQVVVSQHESFAVHQEHSVNVVEACECPSLAACPYAGSLLGSMVEVVH